jgi:serine/threonine protein kinase
MLNQINDYTLLDILGHGSYGIVYLPESFKKEKLALKLIKINDKILKYAITEAQTYVSLNHPNILKAREFFTNKQETYLVIVL